MSSTTGEGPQHAVFSILLIAHSIFLSCPFSNTQRTLKCLKFSVTFRHMSTSYGQFLPSRPTPKLEDRPFSTISDCVLIICRGTHHNYRPSPRTETFHPNYTLKSSGHYMYHQFNIQQLYVLPTQCICVFCVDLRTNSDYFPMQH